ncbi:MAG: mevalonate kinase [Motiliproteus sp.]
MIIRASAPGNLMLMGEHAVLRGELAIACAVDQRINVTLETLDEPVLVIESALGNYQDRLDSLKDDKRLRFVLQAVRSKVAEISGGVKLTIEAEFSHQVGLGSSAAVSVATVAALQQLVQAKIDRRQVFDEARAVMLKVQGRGSGTDLAASTYGALIAYRADPLDITPLQCVPDIALFYSGYKTPTPEVLSLVADESQRFPELYEQLYRLMGKASEQALKAAQQRDWTQLGQLMNYYQGLMDALGVSDRKLAEMVYGLRDQGVYGAKISGSGLGDCVISLGRPLTSVGFDEIPIQVAPEGVKVSLVTDSCA